MALSFSRPDPSSPSAVAAATFTNARKGFEPAEVREFLRMVAAELARLQERERFLEREVRTNQRGAVSAAALDEDVVTRMLGEEAARILQAAREAASQIKIRAEEGQPSSITASFQEADPGVGAELS
jgi:DivIVA domain-containing protein